jgi:aconitate hydratase
MRRLSKLLPRAADVRHAAQGEIDYSVDLELDLADVQPSVAGPSGPQDRINLPELGDTFRSPLHASGERRRLRQRARRTRSGSPFI